MSKTILYSLAFIALGLGSGSLGTMIGSYLIGRFYDRVKGHPLLAFSLAAAAGAMALMPSATLLQVLLLLSAFIGVAGASINVGGNALIVLVHGDRVRPFMSALHFAFGLGGMFWPWLIGQFFKSHGPEVMVWIVLLCLLGALVTLAILILRHARAEPGK
jgi:MFS family permease